MQIRCPYCDSADLAPCPQGLIDLGAKALGEGRLALEASAQGLKLKDLATVLVAGERPPTDEGDRKCPYCRAGRLTTATTKHTAIDVVALVLGFARLYLVAGQGRRLRWVEAATLLLDGKLRLRVEPTNDQDDDDDDDDDDDQDLTNEDDEPAQILAAGRAGRVIDINSRDGSFT